MFADDMITYRKYHKMCTTRSLEAMSEIQQGHEVQVRIQKSYFYVLAPNKCIVSEIGK